MATIPDPTPIETWKSRAGFPGESFDIFDSVGVLFERTVRNAQGWILKYTGNWFDFRNEALVAITGALAITPRVLFRFTFTKVLVKFTSGYTPPFNCNGILINGLNIANGDTLITTTNLTQINIVPGSYTVPEDSTIAVTVDILPDPGAIIEIQFQS